ncbi:MAG: VPLPA-CTERM sorting domain-containing protein [Pseudomonadota bacterium]
MNRTRLASLTQALMLAAALAAGWSANANTAVTVIGTDNLLQQPTGTAVLGYEFVAATDLTVTAIGILDAGSNGLSSPHTLAIWDDLGNVVIQLLVPAGGGELDNGFRYLDINPLVLTADTKFVIGAYYFGGNGDSVAVATSASDYVLDPALTILGGRALTGSLGFPGEDTDEIYFGPNFRFTAVPLPGAAWLLISALGIMGALRRR